MTTRPTIASEALEAALNEGYSAVDNEWTVREMADLMDEALRDAGWVLVPADSLDAAWAEAEAAIRQGWTILRLDHRVPHIRRDGSIEELWQAEAQSRVGPVVQWNKVRTIIGEGPIPAAALRALAAKLREVP